MENIIAKIISIIVAVTGFFGGTPPVETPILQPTLSEEKVVVVEVVEKITEPEILIVIEPTQSVEIVVEEKKTPKTFILPSGVIVSEDGTVLYTPPKKEVTEPIQTQAIEKTNAPEPTQPTAPQGNYIETSNPTKPTEKDCRKIIYRGTAYTSVWKYCRSLYPNI